MPPADARARPAHGSPPPGGHRDLDRIFDDVLDHSVSLFEADKAGLWTVEDGDNPFRLAAHRGLGPTFLAAVAGIRRGSRAAGWRAVTERRTIVLAHPWSTVSPTELVDGYDDEGFRTICLVPVAYLDEPLGLLALYHTRPYDWTVAELDLVESFADQAAVALQNARLYASVRAFAARLDAISDLAARLNRLHDQAEIGQAIVAEVRGLFSSDTARVYRVDHATDMCEPIAFGGTFLGVSDPAAEVLRVPIGMGLTGWVAAHNTAVRVADTRIDPRRLVVGPDEEPESMLVAPMTFDDLVLGVVVVSKKGTDRYSEDDLATLRIFAGFAAQALVNAENIGRLRDQQQELEHRLASQRALLDVNETLLGAGDPTLVMERIADGLRSVVRSDNLTIYRIDRERGVRTAVLARDRYADVILAEEIPTGLGLTGWATEHGEALLANDAHLDPRAVNIPGTPVEAESLIVVPLRVGGDVIGTLNVGRMGEAEAHFSANEFELVKLFAGQASTALQTAEALHAAALRAEHDALTGLRNHGAFQADLETLLTGGPAGGADAVRPAHARPRRFQELQRQLRAPGRRSPPPAGRRHALRPRPGRRPGLPVRRRRVRCPPADRAPGRGARDRRSARRGGRRDRSARGGAPRHGEHRRRRLPGRRHLEGRAGHARRRGALPREGSATQGGRVGRRRAPPPGAERSTWPRSTRRRRR